MNKITLHINMKSMITFYYKMS